MPRAPSEKVVQAEKLFNEGIAMVEIAKKLEVSDGTVRSWKNRYGWGKTSKKNKCNVAKKEDEKSATLQKKKRGGRPGNNNAKGGRGNPHPLSPTKHGGYTPVFMDTLDDDEKALLGIVPEDTELQLMEQIQLFSIRERRILRAINKYREQKGELAVMDVSKNETKRSFDSKEDEDEYGRRQQEKIANEEILPGKAYELSTHTTNKDMIIARLEQELSTIQGKKTKAIEALSKYRMEKARMESESAGNDAVDDWIAAVLGEDVSKNG